jgi:GNAT superfamily N-acetyltransferase
VEVREVDPRDVAAFTAWHDVLTASRQALRPDDVLPDLAESRATALAGLAEREPSELLELLVVLDGGRPVGALRHELPLRDNTHVSYAEGAVLPEARGRGAGTALLGAWVDRTRAGGRTLLMTELDEPPGAEPAGRRFLERHGFEEALGEVRRDLRLPLPDGLLDRVEAECASHAVGYEVLTWRGRCPDDLVEGRAALGRAMSTDVPLGSLDWQEEAWDTARVRERERLIAEQGRTSVVAAARESATGRLVAFTELAARPARPEQVDQWETLVLAEHRGRRLGTLVKTAALRRLVQEVPGARFVSTSNATTNAPMIAVNEALGFVPAGRISTWQRPV